MKYIKLLDPKSIICPKEEIGNDFYLLGNLSLKWSQGIFTAPQYIQVDKVVKTDTFDIAEEMYER